MAEPTARPRAANAARQIAGEVLVNIAAPFLVYTYFDRSLGDVRALLASSVPPIAWSIFEFARRRRVDAVSLLVLGGIVLSLLAFLGGGSVRFLQLRENLVTGAVGLVFLGSVLIRKPLIFALARAAMARQSPAKVQAFEGLRGDARFRRTMTVMTLVWGAGLLAQSAAACVLVFAMTVREFLVVGPIFSYASLGVLTLWTVWFSRRQQRLRERGSMQ